MNIRKIISVVCFAFSCNVLAGETSQVLFDQAFNLKPNQLYELELEDVQAGDQIWTAVYLVGRQNYPGLTAKVEFFMDNHGLLNKANPSEHAVYQTLIAENLTQTNQYSLKQFKGLNTFIEDTSEQLITDPILKKTDSIRIYSQVNDWIPEYNTYEPTKVKFGIQNPLDFDIVAAYVLVGKGEKPAELSELNFKNIQATYASPLPPVPADFTQAEVNKSEMHLSRSELKFIFFIVMAIVMGLVAFINRGKLKRAF